MRSADAENEAARYERAAANGGAHTKPQQARHSTQWAHNTAADVIYGRDVDRQELPPRMHEPDAAGKSSDSYNLAGDHQPAAGRYATTGGGGGGGGNGSAQGASAVRVRSRNNKWLHDTADDAIYGEDMDGDSTPRKHDPDAAGKSSAQVEAEARRTGELGIAPARARNNAYVRQRPFQPPP